MSDQDDIWMDGKVERVLKEFENSKTLCVVHDAEIVDGNMNKVKDSFFELKNGSLAFYIIYIGMRLLDVVWHFVNVFLRRVIRFQIILRCMIGGLV